MNTQETLDSLIAAWKLMVGRLPNSSIQEADGIASMFGNVPLPFLNLIAVARPTADAAAFHATMGLAKARMATCAHGSMICAAEEWMPADWQNLLSGEGLGYVMNLTGMATENLLPARRPAPALDLRRVTDIATATDLARVNGAAYGMPDEMFDCISNLHLWHEDSFGYVGYADGKAVTAAATFPVAGTVYVALVATLPGEQGKGYADAVMRHAIEQGQKASGFGKVVLHASDMGRPVYEAMGFSNGARVAIVAQPH